MATSSLVAVNISDQPLNAGESIKFSTNRVVTGCCIRHSAGSSTFVIPCPGTYLVAFDGDFTITTTGLVTFQLLNQENVVRGAKTTVQATTAEPTGVHFTTVISVPPSCKAINNTAILQITTNAIGVLNNASVSIVKV